jgi:atypical dual specificity phosphatase
MWRILPNLFLGDREDSRDRSSLARHGITHIVNCAAELSCAFPREMSYLRLELLDPDPQFSQRVGRAMEFIDAGRKKGAVLVHCTAGVSRSAAIVLSYLCHCGRPLHQACIELRRAVLTGIDDDFLEQIAAWQGSTLSRNQIRTLSLILAGHGVEFEG